MLLQEQRLVVWGCGVPCHVAIEIQPQPGWRHWEQQQQQEYHDNNNNNNNKIIIIIILLVLVYSFFFYL